MIIKNFKGFEGQHCESTATLSLLKHAGLEMSEPMFIGLGQGLGFIYWKMKTMNLPFIGGCTRPFALTQKFCDNLHISLDERETTSGKKAWSNITEFIDQDIPVGLQLDCYHLGYFHHAFHFAGHFLAVFGYDDEEVYIVDTVQQGSNLKSAHENIEKARFEKGPMSAKARSWSVQINKKIPALTNIIPKAVKASAFEFLHPPINNLGYKGIKKMGKEITKWIDMVPNPEIDLVATAEIMEKGGTGSALFRNFFRDFLNESLRYLPGNLKIKKALDLYKRAAANRTETASLIHDAGTTGKKNCLEKAAATCTETADLEKKAMEILSDL